MINLCVCHHRLKLGAALGSLLALSACGGGGGGMVSTPTPLPSPTPTPAPAPIPTPGVAPSPSPSPVPPQFNTTEFRRSDGPLQHNAAVAWAQGKAGTGVTIAVLDTGIDIDSPEFAGRISSASRDLLDAQSNRSYDATDDHGTNVAMVAAAARDGQGMVGIAWESTILALRTDNLNSCQSDNEARTGDDDCEFSDATIARGIDYAVAQGAQVINLSMGGDPPAQTVLDAVQRAVSAGLIVIVAGGNDGDPNPDPFGAGIDGFVPQGGVILAGSVDAGGVISSFSNRAGNQPNHYLAARGEGVCCVYQNGKPYIDAEGYQYAFSGTSFSAPQIAGAAAILAQAFPNLTGSEIADILLRSAFDAGTSGTDTTYGRGILDIARALQPIGSTSLAGTTAEVALADSSGVTSPAMGDAALQNSLRTVMLDEYRRAFDVELGGTLRPAPTAKPLLGAVGGQRRQVSSASAQTSIALTIDAPGQLWELPKVGYLQIAREDADAARVLAARVALRLSPRTKLAIGYAEGAGGLVATLQGHDRPAFMIARDSSGDSGLVRSNDAAIALRQQIGPWGLTVSADHGATRPTGDLQRSAKMRSGRESKPVSDLGISLDRRFGAVQVALGVTRMQEDGTFLGAKFHQAFLLSGSNTIFFDGEATWSFSPGWRLGASLRQGWTVARMGGMVARGSQLSSRSWSLDLTRANLLATGDVVGLRISQPLRVESGGLNLLLPVDYNYTTLESTFGMRRIALVPRGRELVGEFAWRGPVLGGDGSASLFIRKDPGHFVEIPDDRGAVLRWSWKF